MRRLCRGRVLGISVAIAHGVFSGSLNILLKFLISRYQFSFLTLVQCLTSSTAALSLELLRRLGLIAVPPFGLSLARSFAGVAVLSTLQSSLTLWSLRGLSLPMYVVFKRCLPLVTMLIGVLVLKNGVPSPGVLAAVLITTCGAALAGAGDLTGDPIGYVTGVLAVLVHAAYLVLIQKTSADTEHGPLTAQYVIAVSATPLLVVLSVASTDSIHAWTFPGWKDPAMVTIFVACILIGCAMNFTTLHCTYINSAVTTSFVGVVKSVATITVGMVAFNDVEPTSLFIAGVVVNTLGSIIYCVAKFLETRKQSNYEDLESQQPVPEGSEPSGDQLPFVMEEMPQEGGNGRPWGGEGAGDPTQQGGQAARGSPRGVPLGISSGSEEGSRRSLKDAYLEVWRLVRGTKYTKKDYLIDNEELPSP
uniref:Solute carrier family 35, member D3 n=1 Tax=Jaculus jaculus TaxID=51337 RepID=A0A8C5KQC2_JACJA